MAPICLPMLVLPRCPVASGQALPVLLRHSVMRSSPLILLEIFSASHSLHSLVIFSTFCCKRQELIFTPCLTLIPISNRRVHRSKPPSGRAGLDGRPTRQARGLVGRKEVVKQDWIPTPPLTDFSLENVFLSITRENVRELQRQWEEMMKSDWWQNSSFSCHCTWWGRSCAAARQIC